MDRVQHVKKLREDYERALDAAESKGAAYHEAVLDLINHGEPHARELAEELGLLDHPAPPAVRRRPARRRWNLARAAAALGGVLVLLGLTVAGLRLAQAPPFVPTVRVPLVLDMKQKAAARRLRNAGLNVQILTVRRDLPKREYRRVLGTSSAAGEQIEKGSTVTLYIAIRARRR